MACSPSAGAACGTGQGTLWFRICLQHTAPNSEPDPGCQSLAWNLCQKKRQREPCCSPRSAHKLRKKKLIWGLSVQTGEQLAEREQHQATIPSVLETRKNKYFKSFSKGGRHGVCLLLLLSRSLYHSVSYPSMGLWRWFRAGLWALFPAPICAYPASPKLFDMHSDQTSQSLVWERVNSAVLFLEVFGSGWRGMPADTTSKPKYSVPEQTHRTYLGSSIQSWVQFHLEPLLINIKYGGKNWFLQCAWLVEIRVLP